MVSKELLSEVLPFAGINSELISYGLNADGDILLQYNDMDEVINIHELANKCKVKAYELGYRIESNPKSSKIFKMDKSKNWQLKDTCYNTNFNDPIIFDSMLDILVFERILERKNDNKRKMANNSNRHNKQQK